MIRDEPDVPPLRFDDLAVGLRLRLGEVSVTREAVIAFAAQWDPQPFHMTDEGGAANPVFGRLSSSGWQTVLLMQLVADRYIKRTGLVGLAGGGVDAIRWIKPVFPPEELTIWLEVVAVRPSASRPERGILTFRSEAHDARGDRVCTFEITGIFQR